MRQRSFWKIVGVAGAMGLAGCGASYQGTVVYQTSPPPTVVVEQPAPVVVTTFETDLAPYGEWVVVGGYGRCFRPRGVVAAWRPYTVGHWAWSDYGWTWVSEEPWGFATYHYGRWYQDARVGWVWIPGSTWAPAWVAWRSGGGYVGWAPLGPEVAVGASVEVTEVETRDIPPARFTFVAEVDIAAPRVHEHVVNVRENVTIVKKTTNITRITTVNKTVVNRGVSVEQVERETGRKVQRTTVKEVTSTTEVKRARERGEVVAYRPQRIVEAERVRKVEVEKREVERKRTNDSRRGDADDARNRETQRLEAERARQVEVKRQEAEKARAAEAKRLEAEKARAAEAKRLEAERAKAAEAKRLEAERAKAVEARRLEAERAKAAQTRRIQAERTKAEEAKRAEAERIRREESAKPRPGETKEQAAERVKREAEKEREAARERERRGGNDDSRGGR